MAIAAIPLVLAFAAYTYRDFVTDDAYIFATYARHFVGAGELAFNLGEPLNAISSPAWQALAIGLQALANALGRPDAVILGLRLSSGLCSAAALWVFARLARRLCANERAAALALALFALDPWLWRWAFSGMEAGLAALCVAAALHGLASDSAAARARAFAWLAGAGVLVRPELGLLAGLVGAAALHDEPRPLAFGARVRTLLLGLLPLGLWLGFAARELESVWPQTAAAKRGLLAPGPALARALQVFAVGEGVALGLAALALVDALRTRGVAGLALSRAQARIAVVAALWALALPLGYSALGYAPLSRYLIMATPATLALAALAFDLWLRVPRPARLRRASMVTGLALAAAFSLGATLLRIRAGSTDQTVGAYREVCQWMREHTAPSARIAVPEIGALGYYCDRHLVDVGGLVLRRPELETLRAGGVVALLRRTRPEYWVELGRPGEASPGLAQLGDEVRAQAVLVREVAAQVASRASRPITVTLHRLEWRAP